MNFHYAIGYVKADPGARRDMLFGEPAAYASVKQRLDLVRGDWEADVCHGYANAGFGVGN